MSSYERRFQVCYGMVSFYTDDPTKVLNVLDTEGNEDAYVLEGYPNYRDMSDGRTMVTRSTIGRVPRSTLEYMIERAKVQTLIKELS